MILKRFRSTAWREGSATLLALAIAVALALVDQTYHTGGDLESFLWRWSLLLAPLPWLAQLDLGGDDFPRRAHMVGGRRKESKAPGGACGCGRWRLRSFRTSSRFCAPSRRGLRAANLQWAIALFVCVAAATRFREPGAGSVDRDLCRALCPHDHPRRRQPARRGRAVAAAAGDGRCHWQHCRAVG